jgi:AcrR family transcriptional regulator
VPNCVVVKAAGAAAPRDRRRTRERPGGRSARVILEVLEAALAELTRAGYAALRVEEVAQVAGVNKTTVYRRWPTKMQLVSDALALDRERTHVVPNTGSLREDLRQLLKALVVQVDRPLACAWLAEIGNAEVRAIMQSHRYYYEAEWSVIVARGVARGELPANVSPLFLLELLVSPVVARVTRGEQLPTEAFCDQVIDMVLAGARAIG